MIDPAQALSSIPSGLKDPLIAEYNKIVANYMENRWTSSELAGGKFCEIVYTIIKGKVDGNYPSMPSKPRNMLHACQRLEPETSLPRSFRILIPRMLPVLYEIRNNRNVGHVGGDVNPDHMDSSAVLSMASWILSELIRVYHNVSTAEAQLLVDNLVERRTSLVWKSDKVRRVLDPKMSLKDQILILITSNSNKTKADDLFSWVDHKTRSYFNKVIGQLHSNRFIEFDSESQEIEMLPPGSDYVSKLLENN